LPKRHDDVPKEDRFRLDFHTDGDGREEDGSHQRQKQREVKETEFKKACKHGINGEDEKKPNPPSDQRGKNR